MEQSESERRIKAAIERWDRQREEYARIGWREILGESERAALFDRFCAAFTSGDTTLFPIPNVTWDVRINWPAGSEEERILVDDMHRKCLPAIKRCVNDSQPWWALENCHHPCYRVHFNEMPDYVAEWPIEILPFGDPCYLLAPDFSTGIIAEVHESLTVFGDKFLAAIEEDPQLALTKIIRRER